MLYRSVWEFGLAPMIKATPDSPRHGPEDSLAENLPCKVRQRSDTKTNKCLVKNVKAPMDATRTTSFLGIETRETSRKVAQRSEATHRSGVLGNAVRAALRFKDAATSHCCKSGSRGCKPKRNATFRLPEGTLALRQISGKLRRRKPATDRPKAGPPLRG